METFSVARLLKDLGYKDAQIKTKESLETLTVAQGHKKLKYKPDYVLAVSNLPRCVVDAKGKDESLVEHRAILAALEHHDVVEAEQTMRRHIAQLRRSLQQASLLPMS